MLLRRIHDDQLAQSGCLTGCQETRDAVVIAAGHDDAFSLERGQAAWLAVGITPSTGESRRRIGRTAVA